MPVQVGKLRIVHYPAPVLRVPAEPIEQVTDEHRQVARRMIELMLDAPGVGLAGPQVGLSWRLFVASNCQDPPTPLVFVNPVLKDPSRQVDEREEGCLSIPEVNGLIRRPKRITVEALDLEGRPFTVTSDELPSRIWQHETDHLNGVLIIDRMAPIDRMANRRHLKDLEAAAKM